jgi:hypothetical protein
MAKLHVGVGQVRGSGVGCRPLAGPQRAWRPRLERLETRCLPGFLAPLAFDAGIGPTSVAVGDFNGDGKPDLAVANQGSDNVSVLLGQGDGTFLTAVSYPIGTYPLSVAVGDFNGDGKQDLAVAGGGNNGTVSVLLGNGDGSFQKAVSYAAGSQPQSVAVADFNGDGILDLAVANSTSPGTVRVLLGQGDGTFLPAQSFPAGAGPRSVAVGDFNGDGRPDLVVANPDSNTVSVLLGNGDGTFQPAQSFAAGIDPIAVAVGDFNGDGRLDLAVGNWASTLRVLLGQGDGTFLPALSQAVGSILYSVAVGDLNGDGKPDLAVANWTSDTVSVLVGNGDGTFQAARDFSAGTNPVFVAAGDFNGDGRSDLAVADFGSGGYGQGVCVLLGNGSAILQAPRAFKTAGSYPQSVAVADFNGDGKPDLAVAGGASWEYFGYVSVQLGNGDGTFEPFGQGFDAGAGPRSVAVGDFNGDGKLDLAVAGYGRYQDYYGYWHDFDETVRVLLGKGDGTFQPAVKYTAGSEPVSVAVGDFNGDGKQDLAVANTSGTVSVLLGKGDGTFQPAQTVLTEGQPSALAVGDFNGDGKQDLAVANAYGVSVLLGNGDGTFLPGVGYAAGINPVAVAVVDFNGDGWPDLAVADEGGFYGNNRGVSVLLGNGDGTFQPARAFFSAGTKPVSLAAGDFNSDGFPDLAVANSWSNDVSILLNDTTWASGPSRAHAGPSRPLVLQLQPPPAVLPLPSGEQLRLAASALLALAPPRGNGPVLEPPAPRALPGADPPRSAILAALLAEGRPSALADPRAGPWARAAPGEALDHLFAELAANAVGDGRTADGMPPLA